jgi:hypothetical protein
MYTVVSMPKITFDIEALGGKNSDQYLNTVHFFFNASVN